jgi:hypothetical protein
MPRPKRISPGNTTLKELLIRHDIEPLDELFKMYRETLPCPDYADQDFIAQLCSTGWEPYYAEDGKKRLRMSLVRRKELMADAANFVHPKLRASENHSTTDHSITVTINKIADDRGDEKRITIPIKATLEPKMIE